MAALTTYQGSAAMTEVIPSEHIEDFIASYDYAPSVGLALAWARPGQGSIPVSFPRFDGISSAASSAIAESDEMSDRNFVMSESSITPAIYGFLLKISDQAMKGAKDGVPARALVEGVNYLVSVMDTAVLSAISNVTATSGLVTDTYDGERFRADVAAYKLLHLQPGPLGHVAALSGGMASELIASVENSSAPGAIREHDTLSLGPEQGSIGHYRGFGLYETDRLPASTTGRAGLMAPAGFQASPLGLVLTETPNVETTRGDASAARALTQHAVRAWFGVGVTNPNKGLQIRGAA